MSAVGIDFGNDNCYIAVARAGGIETVANDYSQRATPAYVAFGPNCRDLGTSAKNKAITNLKNTVCFFKRLIGKKFKDSSLKIETTYLPYDVRELPDNGIGVAVSYLGKECIFTIQQISSMLLTKLKFITENAVGNKMADCVISVPVYFKDVERRAMLDLCQIANLNVLRLMNETTAVALAYGFYKRDLSPTKSKKVVFVDFGHSALQASVCEFYQGKLKVVCSVWDNNVGGRDIDNCLVKYFCEEFKKKYNLNVLSNDRAIVRLLQECEKLKKQLSANPQVLPLNIECFMEEKDVSSSLGREKFEELCNSLFVRFEAALTKLVGESNVCLKDLSSVELVGGSIRIPAIRNIIKKVFNMEPSTTLNLDEAVARGCALQAAMLSYNVKVKEFEIIDVQPYAVKLMWSISTIDNGDIEAFPKNHPVPFSKLLTFFRKEDFTLDAYHFLGTEEDLFIGSFTIKNINQPSSGESVKVIVKLRVDIHGIFRICSAYIANKESKDNATVDQHAEDLMDLKLKDPNSTTEVPANEEKKSFFSLKKHKKTTPEVELQIESKVPELTDNELKTFSETEIKMINQDLCEEKRINAKNALEEYVYELRNQLSDELNKFSDQQELDDLYQKLSQSESWLYAEGEEEKEEVYLEKLSELKIMADPIAKRKLDYDQRQIEVAALERLILESRNILNVYLSGDQQYAHIDPKDMEHVQKTVDEKHNWLLQEKKTYENLKPNQNSPILADQIRVQRETLFKEVKNVLNKPKPPPEPVVEMKEEIREGDINC